MQLHPAAADAIPRFDAAVIGPGSFYTSLMPIFLVRGAPEAIQQVPGPIVLVTNLLTEGRGMWQFTAAESVRQMSAAIGRDDRRGHRQHLTSRRRARSPATATSTSSRSKWATCRRRCEVVSGEFWCGDIARHDRRRLAQAVWAVLAKRLL